MGTFMENLKETINEGKFNESYTENGALGYRTTGKELLDANFKVPYFRYAKDEIIIEWWERVYNENKELALRWLFFVSDVRGGLGERRIFRTIYKHIACTDPTLAVNLISLVPYYSRWDNMFVLLDNESTCGELIDFIKNQLNTDMENMKIDKPISLLAKWLPSINSKSKDTRSKALVIAKKLEISEKQYRKMLSALRKYLNIVEVDMCAGKFGNINYEAVPSKANLLYEDAFLRHDEERRRSYLISVKNGEAKINASVLYPHDIVHKYSYIHNMLNDTIEELWKGLPDYTNGNSNTIVVADESGSMRVPIGRDTRVTALDVANSLAVYFSEHCTGEFKNKYITFSEHPQIVDFSNAASLAQKLIIALSHTEVANTNIEAVFGLILKSALEHHISQEEMVDNILIISDMEFDACSISDSSYNVEPKLFEVMSERYAYAGYKLPRLVFWNVNSRTNTIPITENELGVALVSGYSPVICNMVLSNELDPYKVLVKQLMNERYDLVSEAIA